MGAKQREYKNRISSTSALKKIFSAQELIATSRIGKARSAVTASTPYARAISRAVAAVATYSDAHHPLTTEKETRRRAAVLLITSDRGMAGAYSANVLREGERLNELLRDEGVEPVHYITGRKGIAYYKFRHREMENEWSGFSESPVYADAEPVGDALVDAFMRGSEEGGVDEIHIVYTRFVNMVTQKAEVIRLLPIEVVESSEVDETSTTPSLNTEALDSNDLLPLYEFEPNAETVLDTLLPLYVNSRIHNAMLQAAASEHAARQRAMKTAADNAEELIRKFTRLANQARQAEITQEISEIVGGTDALASSGGE